MKGVPTSLSFIEVVDERVARLCSSELRLRGLDLCFPRPEPIYGIYKSKMNCLKITCDVSRVDERNRI